MVPRSGPVILAVIVLAALAEMASRRLAVVFPVALVAMIAAAVFLPGDRR